MKKSEKLIARRQKTAAFLRKNHRAVAVTAIVVFMTGYLAAVASVIAYAFFSSDEVIIGETAENVLYYKKPASKISKIHNIVNPIYKIDSDYNTFQQASLPIGSGDLGAAIYGETECERIVFNEKTLWSGGPDEGQSDYNGDNFTGVGADGLTESERYYAVQNYLLNGDTAAATKLFKNMEGDTDNKGAYLAWGDVYIDFGHKKVKNYWRSLNLDKAVAAVSYDYKNQSFYREYFASNPDKVVAMRFSSDGDFDFSLRFPSKQDGATVTAVGDSIIISGALTDNGLKYCSVLTVDAHGGKVTADGDTLTVSAKNTAEVYVSAATDYKQEYPVYRTGESTETLAKRVTATVDNAKAKGYDSVKSTHISDYTGLFNRVLINLGGEKPAFTTDKLLSRYNTIFLKNSHRRYLEQLTYNYGRYLLIASSRQDSQLPANLQGVWNESNTPPWQSDYHLNINLQMNYWAAYNTNLAECAAPPITDFVKSLREPGRITAKTYTATAEELAANLADDNYGFIAHTECNPYGHTTPGSGRYVRALWSPPAVAWLLQNLYEGYEYGKNTDYLSEIYPVMKEAARYFERTMVTYNGRLITAPSYSPEHGKITAGNTYEQSLVWQLLTDTLSAAKTLNLDEDKQAVWTEMLSKLNPIEIGSGGQIKEWYDETYILSRGIALHRHTSHLLGLFPGDLINKDSNPEYVTAAKVSLDWRGDKSTGWAMGQRINTYARLGEGDIAYNLIKQLFKNGIYPNLFDAHPPFQIDGNFGYTSGVTEMLMQSNLGYIEILPAVPSNWAQGQISGIVVRGNFTLSFDWKDLRLNSLTVYSGSGSQCAVKLKNPDSYTVINNGKNVAYKISDGKIIFDTVSGETYQLIKSN